MAHKNRSGALLICHFCKNNNCGECVSKDLDIAEVFTCHCPHCQPTCSRRECQPENIKGRKVKIAAPVCPRCTSNHPGEC